MAKGSVSPGTAKRKFRKLGLAGLVLLLVAGGLLVWWFSSDHNNPPATTPPQVGYQPNTGTNSSKTIAPACSQISDTSPAQTTASPSPVASSANSRPAPTPVSGTDRYGVIITGLEKEPDKAASISRVLQLSEARWWYQYTADHPPLPATITAHQIYLIRVGKSDYSRNNFQAWVQYIRQVGHFAQPTYWLIGNEPNVPGQDDCSPEGYAETLWELNNLIRAADPQATLIGPNLLNWNHTCEACPGFTFGLQWAEQLQQVYRTRYKSELPFDVWSLHTYSLDWNHLPLLNQAQDAAQLEALRRYLDNSATTRDKPIWLTEFGVVWGYEGLEWQKNSAGEWKAIPKGQLRQDLMLQYLTSSLDWLEANASRLKLQHWFVFTSYGEPESFTETFSGISLFDSPSSRANLTDFGQRYVQYLRKTRLGQTSYEWGDRANPI